MSDRRFTLGAVLFAGATLSGLLALLHARAIQSLGPLCGSGPEGHCGWCYAAAALFLAGMAVVMRADRRLVEVKARRR